MNPFLFSLAAITFFVSCGTTGGEEENPERYLQLGDSIATKAQQNLLGNLTKAISDSGFAYAVAYCNINAKSLIDSVVDGSKTLSVQRITDKNRNPQNGLTEPQDKIVWEHFLAGRKDTVLIGEQHAVYYKPIRIMMPTCLKCHGKTSDLDSGALQQIQLKYPNDLAIGYEQGQLRGLWKVTMQKER